MIAAPVSVPTASQIASAANHLADRASWTFFRVAGERYVAMQSATSGRTYSVRADGQGCSCRYYEVHKALCSHALAVIEAANQDNLSAYLADAADDLLDEYDRQQSSRSGLWHYCKRGCGELLPPENTKPLCDHCFEKARRLLMEED